MRKPALFMIAITVLLMAVPMTAWSATKDRVLYSFTGGADGGTPQGTVLLRGGELYGVASSGGSGNGVVFRLTPHQGKWTETVLHSFAGGSDGAGPQAGLTPDQKGNLYGITSGGGDVGCFNGCGTVFELSPEADGTWTEKVLYRFTGGVDGAIPTGRLVFDQNGNLYGTTQAGGDLSCSGDSLTGCGTVFELSPASDGSWTQTVVHAFSGGTADGVSPFLAGVIFDGKDNLFGTTEGGGRFAFGSVFQLHRNPDSQWKSHQLYSFRWGNDGANPAAGLIYLNGRLYGTAYAGGNSCFDSVGCGVVFELSRLQDGRWTERIIHRFHAIDGIGPTFALFSDESGDLYGTAFDGGAGPCNVCGTAFELTQSPDGSWKETMVYHFGSSLTDAGTPNGGLIRDAGGHLFGTSEAGGTTGDGTVYEIFP